MDGKDFSSSKYHCKLHSSKQASSKWITIIEENVQVPEENKETPHSKVVIHQVENLSSIRDKYPYEILIKVKLPNVDKQCKWNTRKRIKTL